MFKALAMSFARNQNKSAQTI